MTCWKNAENNEPVLIDVLVLLVRMVWFGFLCAFIAQV